MPFDYILQLGKTYPAQPYTYMNIEGKETLIPQNVSNTITLSGSGSNDFAVTTQDLSVDTETITRDLVVSKVNIGANIYMNAGQAITLGSVDVIANGNVITGMNFSVDDTFTYYDSITADFASPITIPKGTTITLRIKAWTYSTPNAVGTYSVKADLMGVYT